MAIPSDTSAAATEEQIRRLQAMSNSQRGALALRLSDRVIALSRRAIARAHPEWSDWEVKVEWARLHYGDELAAKLELHRRRRDTRGG